METWDKRFQQALDCAREYWWRCIILCLILSVLFFRRRLHVLSLFIFLLLECSVRLQWVGTYRINAARVATTFLCVVLGASELVDGLIGQLVSTGVQIVRNPDNLLLGMNVITNYWPASEWHNTPASLDAYGIPREVQLMGVVVYACVSFGILQGCITTTPGGSGLVEPSARTKRPSDGKWVSWNAIAKWLAPLNYFLVLFLVQRCDPFSLAKQFYCPHPKACLCESMGSVTAVNFSLIDYAGDVTNLEEVEMWKIWTVEPLIRYSDFIEMVYQATWTLDNVFRLLGYIMDSPYLKDAMLCYVGRALLYMMCKVIPNHVTNEMNLLEAISLANLVRTSVGIPALAATVQLTSLPMAFFFLIGMWYFAEHVGTVLLGMQFDDSLSSVFAMVASSLHVIFLFVTAFMAQKCLNLNEEEEKLLEVSILRRVLIFGGWMPPRRVALQQPQQRQRQQHANNNRDRYSTSKAPLKKAKDKQAEFDARNRVWRNVSLVSPCIWCAVDYVARCSIYDVVRKNPLAQSQWVMLAAYVLVAFFYVRSSDMQPRGYWRSLLGLLYMYCTGVMLMRKHAVNAFAAVRKLNHAEKMDDFQLLWDVASLPSRFPGIFTDLVKDFTLLIRENVDMFIRKHVVHQ